MIMYEKLKTRYHLWRVKGKIRRAGRILEFHTDYVRESGLIPPEIQEHQAKRHLGLMLDLAELEDRRDPLESELNTLKEATQNAG